MSVCGGGTAHRGGRDRQEDRISHDSIISVAPVGGTAPRHRVSVAWAVRALTEILEGSMVS